MSISHSSPTSKEAPWWRGLLVFVLMAGGLMALSYTTPLRDWFTVDGIQTLVEDLGLWGPVVLTGIALVSPLLMIPRWPIAVVCGALYGVFWGSVFANVISVSGALLHYGFARTFLARSAERLKNGPLSRLNLTPENSFITIFFLRAFPLSNSAAVNLLAGSMRVPPVSYVLASFLGMLPSTLMYVSWGKLLKKPEPIFYGLALGLAILLTLSGWLARRFLKNPLKNITEPS